MLFSGAIKGILELIRGLILKGKNKSHKKSQIARRFPSDLLINHTDVLIVDKSQINKGGRIPPKREGSHYG